MLNYVNGDDDGLLSLREDSLIGRSSTHLHLDSLIVFECFVPTSIKFSKNREPTTLFCVAHDRLQRRQYAIEMKVSADR